jgi:hypothetical protein
MARISSYPVVTPKAIDTLIISQGYDIDADNPIEGNPTGSVTIGSVIDLVNTGLVPGTGTVTSLGVSMPSAFTVSNSPVTTTGVINITGSGTSTQYIDGTGSLQSSELIFNRDSTLNALGYKVIPSDFNFSTIPASYANSILEIRHHHDLGGSTVTLPAGVTLKFEGGKLSNGTLVGDGTQIQADLNDIFKTNISFSGNWELTSVNPIWFGSSFGLNELQKADDLCGLSNGSISITDDYSYTGIFTLTSSISSRKKNKISSTGRVLEVRADNVVIDNIKIEGLTKSSATAPVDSIAVFNNNCKIINCNIIDLRTTVAAESLVAFGDLIIDDCVFQSNFTNFANMTNQNDIIVLRGVNNARIINNIFDIISCNRVFKLADNLYAPSGVEVSDFPCENIFISSNTINATGNSNNKQLLDGYNAMKSISFSNNKIHARGFGIVFEDKTGHAQNYNRSHKVFNNTVDTDSGFVTESGSYGADIAAYNVGYQSIEVYNNDIVRESGVNTSNYTIDVKFVNNAIITNNNIMADATFNTVPAIYAGTTESMIAKGNTITNGIIMFTESFSNQSGDTFSGEYKTIKVSGNTILEYDNSNGCILTQTLRSSSCRIEIHENTIKLLDPQSNTVGAPVYLRDSDFFMANIYNNTSYNHTNINFDYLRLLTCNGTVKDFGNSWNTDVSPLATEAGFTIAAGATESRNYSFPNIKVYDNIKFNIAGRINKIFARSEYYNTQNCAIYYHNPTSSPLAVPSSTIQFEADRSSSGVYVTVR